MFVDDEWSNSLAMVFDFVAQYPSPSADNKSKPDARMRAILCARVGPGSTDAGRATAGTGGRAALVPEGSVGTVGIKLAAPAGAGRSR